MYIYNYKKNTHTHKAKQRKFTLTKNIPDDAFQCLPANKEDSLSDIKSTDNLKVLKVLTWPMKILAAAQRDSGAVVPRTFFNNHPILLMIICIAPR